LSLKTLINDVVYMADKEFRIA